LGARWIDQPHHLIKEGGGTCVDVAAGVHAHDLVGGEQRGEGLEFGDRHGGLVERSAIAAAVLCQMSIGAERVEPDAPRRLDRSRPGGFDRNPWLRSLGSWPRRCLADRRQVSTTTTAHVAGAADRRRRWQARRTADHAATR
jgi:hypothetical protein